MGANNCLAYIKEYIMSKSRDKAIFYLITISLTVAAIGVVMIIGMIWFRG